MGEPEVSATALLKGFGERSLPHLVYFSGHTVHKDICPKFFAPYESNSLRARIHPVKEFRDTLLLYHSLGNILNIDFSFGDQFGMILRCSNGVQ